MKMIALFFRFILLGLLFYVGITAIFGGYKLLQSNGMGMPLTVLEHTPFQTFTLPGLILLCVVGGSQFIALWSIFSKKSFAYETAMIAGFALLIWIFSELYMIGETHWLQVLYFILGILIVVFSIILLRVTWLRSSGFRKQQYIL